MGTYLLLKVHDGREIFSLLLEESNFLAFTVMGST